MEAWFIADIEALKEFYEVGFNQKSIPRRQNVEEIDKQVLIDALEKATRKTKKGKYHKVNHAPEILKRVNVEKVRQACKHCDRLFNTLAEIIDPPRSATPTPGDPGPSKPQKGRKPKPQ